MTTTEFGNQDWLNGLATRFLKQNGAEKFRIVIIHFYCLVVKKEKNLWKRFRGYLRESFASQEVLLCLDWNVWFYL